MGVWARVFPNPRAASSGGEGLQEVELGGEVHRTAGGDRGLELGEHDGDVVPAAKLTCKNPGCRRMRQRTVG